MLKSVPCASFLIHDPNLYLNSNMAKKTILVIFHVIFVKTTQHLHPGDCSAAKRSGGHQDSKKYPVNCLYIAKLMLYLVIYIYRYLLNVTNYFIPKFTLNHSSCGYNWELKIQGYFVPQSHFLLEKCTFHIFLDECSKPLFQF